MNGTTTKNSRTRTMVALLSAILLALVAGTKPAEATFPGVNGKIAFYNNGDVWSMNPDGTGRVQLTTNYNAEDNPAFSPDGSRIAYEFLRGIWLMNADGSGKTNLINDNGTGDQRFVFSPDGAKILFESDRDNSSGRLELYTVGSTTGGAITRLTFNDIWEGNTDWAPVSPRRDIKGTVLGETISGTPGNDTICGLGGNDRINGGGDIVLGGAGNDTLIGVAGRDTLNGGTGTDTAFFAGSTTPVAASLASGFASRTGTSPLTGVAPVGIENLTGSSLSDSLTGSGAVNSLVGGTGADKLYGLAGNDILNSRDSVNGNDSLDGGTGTDQCVKDTTEAAIKACE